MGSNTVNLVSGTAIADDVDQYFTAITGDFLPRNATTGAVQDSAHSLGSDTAQWQNLYAENIFINGALFEPSSIGTGLDLTNAIVSCATRTDSTQPDFIRASGAGASCTILATATPLQITAGGQSATLSADLNVTSLTVAPSSQHTCLINDSTLADQASSKYVGENRNDPIFIDTAGTEITNRIGQYICLKGAAEYMLAFVESATVLRDVRRGFFFDDGGDPVVRETLANNDTLTIMSLGWVFLDINGSTVDVTYTTPIYSSVEPATPVTDDYWFDMTVKLWKRYDGADFQVVARTLIGIVVIDQTNCVASRSFDITQGYSEFGDVNLVVQSNTVISSQKRNNAISIYGKLINFSYSDLKFDIATDLETGLTEANSTIYYLYVSEAGEKIISTESPIDRSSDLRGLYHPYHSWRCVGSAFNNSSGNLVSCRKMINPRGGEIYSSKSLAAISDLTFQGFFRIGYSYRIRIDSFIAVTDPSEVYLRYESGAALITSANYRYANLHANHTATPALMQGSNSDSKIVVCNQVGSASNEAASGEIRFFSPNKRDGICRVSGQMVYSDGSGLLTTASFGGSLESTSEITGFSLYPASGNVESYKISIEEIEE